MKQKLDLWETDMLRERLTVVALWLTFGIQSLSCSISHVGSSVSLYVIYVVWTINETIN